MDVIPSSILKEHQDLSKYVEKTIKEAFKGTCGLR